MVGLQKTAEVAMSLQNSRMVLSFGMKNKRRKENEDDLKRPLRQSETQKLAALLVVRPFPRETTSTSASHKGLQSNSLFVCLPAF